jgi:hypothetical protein
LKNKYEILPISYELANDLIIKHHYLHRKASSMFRFGLFENGELLGCIIYGKPASNAVCKGICGKDYAGLVLELTRLWISDNSSKNAESFLISHSIKMIPSKFKIIVSYAEKDIGHIGIVYQASNWIYTGLTYKHSQWNIQGMDGRHNRHLFDEVGGINKAKEFYAEKMIKVERPRKHRYIFFRGTKKEKKELRNNLKYEVLPYPKKINE